MLSLLFSAVAIGPCYSQLTLNVAGTWSYSVPATDITDAGLDFTGTYTSASNQVLLSISNGNSYFRYRVDVRRNNISWNNKIKLWVRRTGDGIPLHPKSKVWGGLSYRKITKSNKLFFKGKRNTDDIPVQYELRNISILIPAKSYSATIIYTVTAL